MAEFSILRFSALCVRFSCTISAPSFPFRPRSVHVRKEKKEGGPSDSLAESSHQRSSTANPGWAAASFWDLFPRRKMAVLKIQEQVRVSVHGAPRNSVRVFDQTNQSCSLMFPNTMSHQLATYEELQLQQLTQIVNNRLILHL